MSTIQVGAQVVAAEGFDVARQQELVRREMAKRSFCTLATTSAEMRPHVAGLRYVLIDDALYVTMHHHSVKARNLRENPRVAVCIPARKLPLFPPYTVQFQGRATLLAPADQRIQDLFAAGRLKGIISARDFEHDPGTIFARIVPNRRITSYGIGVSPLQIIREPTSAIRTVDLRANGQG